jgi:hypothetical protein
MIDKFKASFNRQQAAVTGLLLLGFLLRLRQYLTGRSLWSDEAMLALNIINRNVIGLFKPLDYDQGAPIGFLFVEKLLSTLFGRNEYSLRFFPLVVGIAAMWLFYILLKRTNLTAGLFAALALFILNPRLIYYSSEVKQYIVDVAITILLLLLVFRLFESQPQTRGFMQLAIAGFIALWFSHPALFVLAGIGLALLVVYVQRRDYVSLRYIFGMGLLWLITIGLLYLLILKDLQHNAFVYEYWQGAFLPLPPWAHRDWFSKAIHENIGIQFGIPYAPYLVFILMLLGWIFLWRRNQSQAITLGLIFIITLAASAFQLYPVYERMILFLIPIGLLLLGETVDALYQSLQQQRALAITAALVFCGYLIYGPLATSTGFFMKPRYYEHIRPSMQYLQENWQPGDAIYVSNGARAQFEYYAPLYGLMNVHYISSPREDYQTPENMLRELDAFKGKSRVWILFSHVYEKGDFNEKNFIFDYVKGIGSKKREFRIPGTSVFLYLFDLTK